MIEQQIAIPTKDGHTATFIAHPERGGAFPVILFYMDAPAIREELRDMARRLALVRLAAIALAAISWVGGGEIANRAGGSAGGSAEMIMSTCPPMTS